MSIPGYATVTATHQYAEQFKSRYPTGPYRRLGRTQLQVSPFGFGTYRCHAEVDIHREALQRALRGGCNVIDTSANYANGNSEVLIGDVLNEEIVWGELLQRENVVVISKAGYIQGENLEIAQAREAEENSFPEVVKYQPGLWHCIHPQFIEDQITRSLVRMHLDVLDVYLLHNPEYYLSLAHYQKMERASAENQFYQRIRRAFVQLEKLVKEGLIRYYGISSNGFPLPSGHPEFVSLDSVWSAYRDACLQSGLTPEQGHFAVIQLPFNWVESGAATLQNHTFQKRAYTVFELAKKLDLGVLVNRPLNAVRQNRLLRLAGDESRPPLADLAKRFRDCFPGRGDSLSFSQKALLVAAAAAGVDVALNGMRTPHYVEAALKTMETDLDVDVRCLF